MERGRPSFSRRSVVAGQGAAVLELLAPQVMTTLTTLVISPRMRMARRAMRGGYLATPALSVDTTLRVAEPAQHAPRGGDLDAVLRRVAGPALAVAVPTVALLSSRRRGSMHAAVGLLGWQPEGGCGGGAERHLAVWALPAAWPASLQGLVCVCLCVCVFV